MIVYLKYIILIFGLICFGILLNNDSDQSASLTGAGIFGAGCLIAFALIENNDVTEKNKK